MLAGRPRELLTIVGLGSVGAEQFLDRCPMGFTGLQASILGVRLPYTGIGWEDGVPIGGWAFQVDRRPRSIESVWQDNAAARLGL